MEDQRVGLRPENPRLFRGVEGPRRGLAAVDIGELHLHRCGLRWHLYIERRVLRGAVRVWRIAWRQLENLVHRTVTEPIAHLQNWSRIFFCSSASAEVGSKLIRTMSACSPRLSRQVT